MDFSISSLLAGLIYGAFGVYLLKEARKTGNFWHLFLGVGLIAYPYFVEGMILNWGIGAAMLGLAYVKR